ncbi:MAG TPA: hypothetical protein VGL97_02110 [Bryobacteraceae bacterium]
MFAVAFALMALGNAGIANGFQTTPATTESGATDRRSFGLYNGRSWKVLSEGEKLWYLTSFIEGLKAGNQRLTDHFVAVSYSDVLSAVNRFYSDPENVLVSISDSLLIVKDGFNGVSPGEIAKAIAAARQLAIRAEARTAKPQARRRGRVEMTIDERLEALTQSVELLAGMQKVTEAEQKKTTTEIRKLARLVRVIVVDHEARLLNLEGDEEGDDGAGKG